MRYEIKESIYKDENLLRYLREIVGGINVLIEMKT